MAQAKKKEKTRGSKTLNIEKAILENFVETQRVMVDLSSKLSDLSMKISRLLDLFEATAKSLTKKDFEGTNTAVIKKIDSVIEQNKTLAKGLSMMYEGNHENSSNFSNPKFRQYPAR